MAAVIAALLVLAVVMIGCSKGGGFDAPGPVAAAEDLPKFEGDFVGSEYDAVSMLNDVINSCASGLQSAYNDALWDKVKYDGKGNTITADFSKEQSISDGKVQIDATGSYTITSNLDIAKLLDYSYESQKGDYYETKGESSVDFLIEKAVAVVSYSATNYTVAGKVHAAVDGTYKETLISKHDSKDNFKIEKDTSSNSSTAWALTISNKDTKKGAKFIFSSASESTGTTRATNSSSNDAKSNVEVYDNSNVLKYTIQTGNSTTVSASPSGLLYYYGYPALNNK